MAILEHGVFRSADDLVRLEIIDWHRLNGYWRHSGEALDSVSSWLIGTSHWSILRQPMRDDSYAPNWPRWKHVGDHEYFGRLFWNHFHANYSGELILGDEPDFTGVIRWKDDASTYFCGDFGQVSASVFALMIRQLRAHDLWISVLDDTTQVVIERLVDMSALYHARLTGIETRDKSTPPSTDKFTQLQLTWK